MTCAGRHLLQKSDNIGCAHASKMLKEAFDEVYDSVFTEGKVKATKTAPVLAGGTPTPCTPGRAMLSKAVCLLPPVLYIERAVGPGSCTALQAQ